jgi:xylulokinase
VLAVDLGTGGPKVGFVSLTGAVAWQDHVAVETTWLGDEGAVQDAEAWWTIIGDAVRRALASGTVRADRVVAVSITGQWASTVPVDESGRPVGDCVMWMDKRGGRHVGPIIGGRVAGYAPKNAATWLRRTGAAPSPQGGDPIGHMLFLERECPDVAKATAWYLEPVDYLSMRFTGVAAASPASMTAAWLTDNRKLDRLDYDEDLLRLSTVDPAKLPPLQATGTVIGPVRDDVADELGLPRGVQVVTGTPDLHSATYGAGAVLDYEPNMAISTTSWITAPVPFKRTDPIHGIASIPGAPPGRYLIVDNQDAAGRCYQWLRDLLADGDHRPDYDSLTALAAEAPAGAGKVIFTPWLNGERSPVDDRRARGGFHNVSLSTTRADLVRAVLEGVAYNSRWLLGYVERFAKRPLDDIRLIGGGATSDVWCQTLADVMDRRIERVEEPLHAGIRGAAIYAGVALGAVQPTEVRSMVKVDRTFTPNADNRAIYDELFAEVPKLYKAQKAMFKRLNWRRRP